VSYPALLVDVTIFVLSLWVGFEVISKVPATLHTPLMSAANSIHGIVLAGAMLIAATANNAFGYVLAFIAAAFAGANVVGGYVVTGRMLKMFRKRPEVTAARSGPAVAGADGHHSADAGANGSRKGLSA
jgi:H+-translocating NAD(P) transhydrogenase subunit alpha